MRGLSAMERDAVQLCAAAPMLEQVRAWSAINSGSRNLPGLAGIAEALATAFAALPGKVRLVPPSPVETVAPDGEVGTVAHGDNLHLTVRPDAPVQLLFTGHMDTVFGADHAFQSVFWREDNVLGGPGVADMKGGLAVMLAACLYYFWRLDQKLGALRSGQDGALRAAAELGQATAQAAG